MWASPEAGPSLREAGGLGSEDYLEGVGWWHELGNEARELLRHHVRLFGPQ